MVPIAFASTELQLSGRAGREVDLEKMEKFANDSVSDAIRVLHSACRL